MLVALLLVVAAAADQTAETADWKRFRSHNANFVWDKARRRLDLHRLKGLYTQLGLVDRRHMLAKDALDKNGENMDDVEKSLVSVLREFNLDDLINILHLRKGNGAEPGTGGPDEAAVMERLSEGRLRKLWGEAVESGHFAPENLSELGEELLELQVEMDGYLSRLRALPSSANDVDYSSSDASTEKRALKKMNSHVEERLLLLAARVKAAGAFSDPRLSRIWERAQGLAEEAKAALAEELRVLARKLEKLRWLEAEAAGAHAPELHKRLKHYAHNVDKIENDLRARLDGHTEL